MKTIAYIIFLFLFGSLYLNAQQEHVVTRGETFETIARKYSITVEELMEANKVSNVCYVGRKLVIPTFGIPLSKDTVLPDYIEKMLISNDKKVLTKDLAATYQVGYAFYLRSAAEDGETRAFFPLADCYLQNDPNKNEDEALFWLQKTVNESKDKGEVKKASALLKEMCKDEETELNDNSINNDIASYNNNQNEREQNNPTIATNTNFNPTMLKPYTIKDMMGETTFYPQADGSSKTYTKSPCSYCHGSRMCSGCQYTSMIQSVVSYNYICTMCGGTHICSRCGGKGYNESWGTIANNGIGYMVDDRGNVTSSGASNNYSTSSKSKTSSSRNTSINDNQYMDVKYYPPNYTGEIDNSWCDKCKEYAPSHVHIKKRIR